MPNPVYEIYIGEVRGNVYGCTGGQPEPGPQEFFPEIANLREETTDTAGAVPGPGAGIAPALPAGPCREVPFAEENDFLSAVAVNASYENIGYGTRALSPGAEQTIANLVDAHVGTNYSGCPANIYQAQKERLLKTARARTLVYLSTKPSSGFRG